MSAYSPTTEQVERAYITGMRQAFIASAGEHREEFQRWLAEVERAARERGWDEALSALADNGGITAGPNPYQQKGQDDD